VPLEGIEAYSDDEIERLANGVELLAAHTPETVPPRRGLAILGQS